jgi:hypothetical protein
MAGCRQQHDQPGLKRFVQRMLCDRPSERDQYPCAEPRTGTQRAVRRFFDGEQMLTVHSGEARVRPHLRRDSQSRGSAPQGEGLDQQLRGLGRIPALRQPAGLLAHGSEPHQIKGVGIHLQAIAAGAACQPP